MADKSLEKISADVVVEHLVDRDSVNVDGNGRQQSHEFNEPVWNFAHTITEKRTVRLLLIPALTMCTTMAMSVINYEAYGVAPDQMCFAVSCALNYYPAVDMDALNGECAPVLAHCPRLTHCLVSASLSFFHVLTRARIQHRHRATYPASGTCAQVRGQ